MLTRLVVQQPDSRDTLDDCLLSKLRAERSIWMPQLVPQGKIYDVCIIGSGAGGGTAAKVLTEGGLTVVMLEAGPPLDPMVDFKEHVWPYELPHRGAGVGGNALKPGNGLEE